MSKFKVGDRARHTTYGKGTVIAFPNDDNIFFKDHYRIELDNRVDHFEIETKVILAREESLKRLIKKKKPRTKAPTREPRRVYIPEYQTKRHQVGYQLDRLYYSNRDEIEAKHSDHPDFVGAVEFVEVLK